MGLLSSMVSILGSGSSSSRLDNFCTSVRMQFDGTTSSKKKPAGGYGSEPDEAEEAARDERDRDHSSDQQ
jgi:hypothetical protein